jgi:hypothetical protein
MKKYQTGNQDTAKDQHEKQKKINQSTHENLQKLAACAM